MKRRLALVHRPGATGSSSRHLALIYPQVPRQTCWVHVLLNVAQLLRVRDRGPCLVRFLIVG
jgi:hypothetical protein